MNTRIPKRFRSLHNHTTFSAMDGIGYPEDHFKFVIENEMDSYALTEHGNMSSYAHAQLWAEEWNKNKANKAFKYIPGVEAYFHPDLEQWKRDKADAEQAATDKKLARKLMSKQEELATKLI